MARLLVPNATVCTITVTSMIPMLRAQSLWTLLLWLFSMLTITVSAASSAAHGGDDDAAAPTPTATASATAATTTTTTTTAATLCIETPYRRQLH